MLKYLQFVLTDMRSLVWGYASYTDMVCKWREDVKTASISENVVVVTTRKTAWATLFSCLKVVPHPTVFTPW